MSLDKSLTNVGASSTMSFPQATIYLEEKYGVHMALVTTEEIGYATKDLIGLGPILDTRANETIRVLAEKGVEGRLELLRMLEGLLGVAQRSQECRQRVNLAKI